MASGAARQPLAQGMPVPRIEPPPRPDIKGGRTEPGELAPSPFIWSGMANSFFFLKSKNPVNSRLEGRVRTAFHRLVRRRWRSDAGSAETALGVWSRWRVNSSLGSAARPLAMSASGEDWSATAGIPTMPARDALNGSWHFWRWRSLRASVDVRLQGYQLTMPHPASRRAIEAARSVRTHFPLRHFPATLGTAQTKCCGLLPGSRLSRPLLQPLGWPIRQTGLSVNRTEFGI